MPQSDWFFLMGAGGVFLLLGLAGILWGRYEEKKYFEAMTRQRDMREFVSHWPERPQPGALRTGGWISIGLGALLLLTGFIGWLATR
jgi:hypothetical protein